MMLETSKDSLCMNKILGRKSEVLLIEGDAIVPDIKPDILSILKSTGTVCIYKKEIIGGKVRIDGSINAYVMYLADSVDSNVRAINTSLDFSKIIEFPEAVENAELDTNIELKRIESKVLNGRKISMKAEMDVGLTISMQEDTEYVKSVTGDPNIQLLNNEFSINTMFGKGISKAYAKDTIMIENIDNLAEILQADIRIINKDVKISYNKVLAKADARVKIMYLTEDGRIANVSNLIPVMGFIDIQDITEENICDVKYEIKNVILKPNNVEEHSIYVEAEIELNCHVYENRKMEMISDLYSTTSDITFSPKNVDIMEKKTRITDICNIREKQKIEEIAGNKIYEASTVISISKQTVLNNQILFEGEASVDILYEAQTSKVESKIITIPYSFSMNSDEIKANCDIDTSAYIISDDFITMPDGSLEIKIDLNFDIAVISKTNINIIQDITVEENRTSEVFSIVIYFVKPGDTLWKIAKAFKSTVDEIAKINEIENVNQLKIGQRLFIPRYVVTNQEVLA